MFILLGETNLSEREKMLARQIKEDPTYEMDFERAAGAHNRRQVEAGNKLEDELDRITADLVVQNRIIEISWLSRLLLRRNVPATSPTGRQHGEV